MSKANPKCSYSDYIQRQNDGRVCTLTLNRPQQYNALSEGMLAALRLALAEVAADETVRVVVLAANGRAFCAGHDLKQMRANPSKEYLHGLFRECAEVMQAIIRLPQPVIGQVHGIATAAGCQLVATCDLAIASSDARFAVSGVNLGLFCSTPGVALVRNIPRKRALEMLFTGEFIDASTAERYHLINRVVEPEALDGAVKKLATMLAAKPSTALRLGKQAFYRQIDETLAGAYDIASETMACNMMDPAAVEGIDAFIEKRKPDWVGE